MFPPLVERIITVVVVWLVFFILSIKSMVIVDRKYKQIYKLTRTIKLGFFRKFLCYSNRAEGKIAWHVLILNGLFLVFNINCITLFAYFLYKAAWGIDVWGYSTAALVFAWFQLLIPLAAIGTDFFFDFSTDKIRYGLKKVVILEEEEDPYADYESNT